MSFALDCLMDCLLFFSGCETLDIPRGTRYVKKEQQKRDRVHRVGPHRVTDNDRSHRALFWPHNVANDDLAVER